MNSIRKVSILAAVAALLSLAATSPQASLVERDFAAANDGLLIFDSATNREWVDVTHTTGMSVNQFFSSSIYANAGFKLAKNADVSQFFYDAGASIVSTGGGTNYQVGNYAAAVLLNTLMEHQSPYRDSGGNSWVHGYTDFGSATQLTLSRFITNGTTTATFDLNTNGTSWTRSSTNSAIGLFAYREVAANAVPEPTSLALVGIGILGLAGMSCKKKSQC